MKFNHLPILFLTLLAFSCVEDSMNEPLVVRVLVNIDDDAHLSDLQQQMATSSNGRTNSNFLERAEWDRVYKIYHSSINRYAYTVPLTTETPNVFENLILLDRNGTTSSFVIRYSYDQGWYDSGGYARNEMETYSGNIALINLAGEVLADSYYEDGTWKSGQTKGSEGGRTDDEVCVTTFKVEIWNNCTSDGCILRDIEVTSITQCVDVGGGSPSIDETPDETGGNDEGEGAIGVLIPDDQCDPGFILKHGICTPAEPLPEIDITITNPCIKNQVAKASDVDVDNSIINNLKDALALAGDDMFNIEIKNGTFLRGSATDGQTTGSNFIGIDIFINPDLSNSSSEYVTATIYHEYLHATWDFLDLYRKEHNPSFSHPVLTKLDQLKAQGIPESKIHHKLMETEYMDDLRIAIRGMHPSIKDDELKALTKYGITLLSPKEVDINSSHRKGTKGTDCK